MLLYALTAHAQHAECARYAPDRLRAELAAAEQALVALRIERAVSLLDEIHRQVRCLDQVIEPADLARLARSQALRFFYEQDPEPLTGWAQLAEGVDPRGPWPVDGSHPVQRFVDPELVPNRSGPSDAHVDHPRRGGLFLDGLWLAAPEAAAGMPHLVQVFDGSSARVDSWWQDGGAFPDAALASSPTEAHPPRWWRGEAEAGPDPMARWAPARKDTVRAYARYLERHPGGEHAAEARHRLDDKDWEAAAASGTADAARAYLEAWPRGRNVDPAQRVLEAEAFRAALDAGTREALVLFRGRHPRGMYAAEATRRLDDLAWLDATRADTAEAYQRYRFHWPAGQHVREARLAQQEHEWTAAVQAGTERALRDFLQAWPSGSFAELAALRLAGATFTRVTLDVSGPGAGTVTDALRRHLEREGFTVGPGEGAARLEVQITGTGTLVGEARLWARGISAPLAAARVRASEPDQLGAWLVDALPPMRRWRP